MAKILLAEDEAAVREFISRALAIQGHDVDVACDGDEALTRLKRQTYDLLITDVIMPGMDGIALSLHANELQPAIKVLVITGYAEAEHRAAVNNGAVAQVLTKPFSLQEICLATKEAIAEQIVAA